VSANIQWHEGLVDDGERSKLLGHRAATVWLTGLSGSGKSTMCRLVERTLVDRGVLAYVLDGDNLRHGLCSDLGFDARAREENVRRAGEVAKLITDAGLVVLTAFISPFRRDRDRVRALFADGAFLEVHVATPLAICEARDPKGLWAKARRGEIADFTGLDSPYEPPDRPELRIAEQGGDKADNAAAIVRMLEDRAIIPRA
jgi:adenylylsulfate kinase